MDTTPDPNRSRVSAEEVKVGQHNDNNQSR